MTKPVLKEHQPDALPPAQHPSLRLYLVIGSVALLFVAVAFIVKGEADWPGLFLNVSSGLISALVVLIVVERRLRQSDLLALQQVPIKAQMSLVSFFNPSARVARAYAISHLESLDGLLSSYIDIPEFTKLEKKLLAGCNLLAEPGMGKTTWMQSVLAKHAQNYLDSNGKEKLVVLYPLKQWSKNVTLEDAVIEHIITFTSCSKASAKKFLNARVSALLLDGYDEIFMRDHSIKAQYKDFKMKYPNVFVSVSSRPHYPDALLDIPTIELPSLSSEQIDEVVRARKSRRQNT